MTFPVRRPRRLRKHEAMRNMVAEAHVGPQHLIQPLFAIDGTGVNNPIGAMPGCFQQSCDQLVEEARSLHDLGVPAIILFGLPDSKDPEGTSGYDPNGIVPRAIDAIKKAVPDLLVWADVCLCEYTSHGHCGIVKDGGVDNDATLPLLAQAATVYADAGADVVAPSDMMDGRVGAIRDALDSAGHVEIPIVSYAAKYASAFYGPFRDAAQSAPAFGDRRAYQMDPANSNEALLEVKLDLEEGADMVMVKPALAYMDIIHRVKTEFQVPVAAYNVSGEYSMIKAAAANGWIDEQRMVTEMLLSMRRAGADVILTYFAKDFARWANK